MHESNVLPFEENHVRGFFHLPSSPSGTGLVLTHGAGSNCQSLLLIAIANVFSESGMTVLRCDLPFRQLRPHGPPPRGSAEHDQEGLRRAIESVRLQVSGRVFLGGHSYGGRQASMLAASQPGFVDRLLLLSYPLHSPKRPTEMRTTHFPNLRTPALFVHGGHDGFGTIEQMTEALKLIPARTERLAVAGAGHELLTKRNAQELPNMIATAFRRFFNPDTE